MSETIEVVYTTGQVARICRVAPRTVSKWIDAGELEGYRLPASQDRRVKRSVLLQFLQDRGLPTDLLPGGTGGGGRVLAVGLPEFLVSALDGLGTPGGPLAAVSADDLFDAGVSLSAQLPSVVVADPFAVQTNFPTRLRAVAGCDRVPVVAILPDATADSELAATAAHGFAAAFRASDVERIKAAVAGWKKLNGTARRPHTGGRAEHKNRVPKAAARSTGV